MADLCRRCIESRMGNVVVDGSDESSLLVEEEELLHELERVRQQRLEIHKIRTETACQLETSLLWQINTAVQQQEEALLDYQSAVVARNYRQNQLLQPMRRWTGANDCFYISTQGPFATINGLRLGSEAPPDALRMMHAQQSQQGSSADGRYQVRRATTDSFLSRKGSRGDTAVAVRVPWSEVNSALGQVALLLKTLSERSGGEVAYSHEILCRGSTSQIGLRRTPTSSVAYYPLYSDDSFQFFGRRSFHTALQALTHCVAQAAVSLVRRNPTLTLPHPLQRNPSTASTTMGVPVPGEWTVGGLAVTYNDGATWTQAMKYLLTDVKHLLVHRPLGLWDPTQTVAGRHEEIMNGTSSNKSTA